jgi:ABC-type molybdenum transport system ATPase subunit/photorepair protein PhrA
MPTGREFQELAEKCTWEVEDNDHVRLTGPNGKSILLDRNVHWTGEKPFGYVTLFGWGYQQNDVKWLLMTTRDLNKSYTELYLQIRPVCGK